MNAHWFISEVIRIFNNFEEAEDRVWKGPGRAGVDTHKIKAADLNQSQPAQVKSLNTWEHADTTTKLSESW